MRRILLIVALGACLMCGAKRKYNPDVPMIVPPAPTRFAYASITNEKLNRWLNEELIPLLCEGDTSKKTPYEMCLTFDRDDRSGREGVQIMLLMKGNHPSFTDKIFFGQVKPKDIVYISQPKIDIYVYNDEYQSQNIALTGKFTRPLQWKVPWSLDIDDRQINITLAVDSNTISWIDVERWGGFDFLTDSVIAATMSWNEATKEYEY